MRLDLMTAYRYRKFHCRKVVWRPEWYYYNTNKYIVIYLTLVFQSKRQRTKSPEESRPQPYTREELAAALPSFTMPRGDSDQSEMQKGRSSQPVDPNVFLVPRLIRHSLQDFNEISQEVISTSNRRTFSRAQEHEIALLNSKWNDLVDRA